MLSGLFSSRRQLTNNCPSGDLFFFFTFECLPFVSNRFPWSAIHKCTSILKSWLQAYAVHVLETCCLWSFQITGYQSPELRVAHCVLHSLSCYTQQSFILAVGNTRTDSAHRSLGQWPAGSKGKISPTCSKNSDVFSRLTLWVNSYRKWALFYFNACWCHYNTTPVTCYEFIICTFIALKSSRHKCYASLSLASRTKGAIFPLDFCFWLTFYADWLNDSCASVFHALFITHQRIHTTEKA